MEDAPIGERTRCQGNAPLEGAVRNVHRRDAKDAEMLQLVSPRALCLGGVSQFTPKLSIPVRAGSVPLKVL